MLRRVGFVLLVVAALSSCASDASTLSSQSSPATTEPIISEASNSVEATDAPAVTKDFGSTFIGAPTAFWFWAPY